MQEFNYRQEFPLIVDFYYKNEHGKIEDFGFPVFDFKIFFWTTSRANAFVASCKYEHGEPKYVNCRRKRDELIVIFNGHGLQPGDLHSELVMEIPDDLYPDGYRTDPFVLHSDVRLIHGPTLAPSMAEIKAILPYIKGKDGKDFSYEEMTDEQKEELAKRIAENIDLKIPELSGELEDISDAEWDSIFSQKTT